MRKTYKATITGLGNIAWRFDHNIGSKDNFLTHAYSYIHNSRTELFAGCSPNDGDRQSFGEAFGVPVFNSIEEMVDRVRPDIISICSPLEFHFEQVLFCLEWGVPMIWLEKPPGKTVAELNQLIGKQAERGSRSKVLVNYQRRYVECYMRLRELYRDNLLGKCKLIRVTYSKGLELNGSHMLDILFYIVGEHAEYELKWVSTAENSENPSFALTFKNGIIVQVDGLDLPYHCIDISLACEEGRASVLHGGMTPLIEDRVEHELFPGFYRLKWNRNNVLGSGGFGNCMEKALEDLICSFEQGVNPKSNILTARSTQELIELVRLRQREVES